MAPVDLRFDVSKAVGQPGGQRGGNGEALTQSAWLFLPDRPQDARAALVCLAGGTYDKRYWHMEVAGHSGYSFAEHMAANGYVVVAVDHLGVGDSSDPKDSGELDLSQLAVGDAEVASQVRAALRAGTLTSGVPALDLPLIGVGHSMGSCLAIMVQANAKGFDALALLGYGVDIQITNVRDAALDEDELEQRVAHSEALLRQSTGATEDAAFAMVSREMLRPNFYASDVPEEVIAADTAAESRVPVRAAAEVTTPGYVERYARAVDVPVFLGFGASVDVSPDPFAEPANYRESGDVTLFLVPGSAHCHNFSGNRAVLWDRVAAWASSLPATE